MLRTGYTLLELLVVIAIIALVAALAAPATGHIIQSARFRSQASEMTAKLRGLQNEAVRTQQTITLQTRSGRLATTDGRIVYAADDVSIEASGPITFFPDGTTDGGHLALHSGEQRLPIEVAWLTGNVTVGVP